MESERIPRRTRCCGSGIIWPIADKVLPFEKTKDALANVETGRAKGKVVITVTD